MKSKILSICILLCAVGAEANEAESGIGYNSVSEAIQDLKANPNAQISLNAGWTIATLTENGNYVMWSFTPDGHDAHPTAVKREVIEKDGAIHIQMNALCQSTKEECDTLIDEFKQLNDKIRQSVQKNS